MAKRKGRPPKIDESGREILREIVTAQPHATLAEVTAEFMRRTELTVTAATVLKALRQAGVKRKRGAVVVKRRAAEEEAKRYGYRDEHRRQEPEQRYPSCLTQDRMGVGGEPVRATGKARSTAAVQPLGDGECVLLRGAQRLFMADVAARVSTLGECVSHLPALGCGRQVRADA